MVEVNGKLVFPNSKAKRGINIVALCFNTHNLLYTGSYDTYNSSSESTRLVNDLKDVTKIPKSCVIVATVKDEASNNLSTDCKNIFKSMGSNEIQNLGYREGWSFICVNGSQRCAEKRG